MNENMSAVKLQIMTSSKAHFVFNIYIAMCINHCKEQSACKYIDILSTVSYDALVYVQIYMFI